MQNKRILWDVATWEFNRWFKWKDQLITLIFGAVISLLIFGGSALLKKYRSNEKNVAVLVTTGQAITLPTVDRVKFAYYPYTEKDRLVKQCYSDSLDGVLILHGLDSASLVLREKGDWVSGVETALTAIYRQGQLQKSGLSAEQLKKLFAEAKLHLEFTTGPEEKVGTTEKVAAGMFIGLMLIGVFVGLSYQFVAITGEKQLRITEVIISAVSPQTWIDAKIIGISLLSLVLLCTLVVSSMLFLAVSLLFGSGWEVPIVVSNPASLLIVLVLSMLGFMVWNTFFAAIAATINDPNTSARGSFIMLPTIGIAFAFSALSDPHGLFIIILSMFPFTSAPVMCARIVVSTVPWYEIAASITILMVTIHLLRNFAGRIFSLSLLMYGKEPSIKEMLVWLKKRD